LVWLGVPKGLGHRARNLSAGREGGVLPSKIRRQLPVNRLTNRKKEGDRFLIPTQNIGDKMLHKLNVPEIAIRSSRNHTKPYKL